MTIHRTIDHDYVTVNCFEMLCIDAEEVHTCQIVSFLYKNSIDGVHDGLESRVRLFSFCFTPSYANSLTNQSSGPVQMNWINKLCFLAPNAQSLKTRYQATLHNPWHRQGSE